MCVFVYVRYVCYVDCECLCVRYAMLCYGMCVLFVMQCCLCMICHNIQVFYVCVMCVLCYVSMYVMDLMYVPMQCT